MASQVFAMGLIAPLVVAGCSPPASDGADNATAAVMMPVAQQAPPADFLRSCLIVAPQAGLLDENVTAAMFANALAPKWHWEKQPGDAYIVRQVRDDAVSQRQIKASYLLQRLSPDALRQYGQDYAPAKCGPSAVVLSRVVDDGVELKLTQIYGLAMQVVTANYRNTEAAKAEARRAARASVDASPVEPTPEDAGTASRAATTPNASTPEAR